jgi:hypothetical protein
VLNAGESVVADSDAAEGLGPTDRSLDDPSHSPEAASVILSATNDDGLDALCTQGVASRLTVVSAIREEDIRTPVWPASLAGHSEEIGDNRKYLPVTGDRPPPPSPCGSRWYIFDRFNSADELNKIKYKKR